MVQLMGKRLFLEYFGIVDDEIDGCTAPSMAIAIEQRVAIIGRDFFLLLERRAIEVGYVA